MDCIFCKVVNKELAGTVVFEDDQSMAFLDHRPLFHGHCLLVPKQHFETLADLPAELIKPLFENSQLLSRAVETAMKAQGTFVAMNIALVKAYLTCTFILFHDAKAMA